MIQEFRRARRRKAADMIQVSDAMTGEMVGRIGNLSESGLLLIASSSLENDALYQLRFTLPGRSAGALGEDLELGAQLLWSDRASAPGQVWGGLRFVALSDAQARQLRAWVESPGGQFV
ncbi:PilZ domain-containing protein [Luteimonas sp. MHLX1A]|uniref:PilZ domain-containing protein n=1 Tax=Alterluteimonas muca TaxID=2878684 RepID=UPI001E2D8E47|nr:PilZ domain-containing protein [Luteimonas sp. MHLX1A]MCD9047765.1 PilZ domain-containing protein [Luteimonas sp. MHLX1A]